MVAGLHSGYLDPIGYNVQFILLSSLTCTVCLLDLKPTDLKNQVVAVNNTFVAEVIPLIFGNR